MLLAGGDSMLHSFPPFLPCTLPAPSVNKVLPAGRAFPPGMAYECQAYHAPALPLLTLAHCACRSNLATKLSHGPVPMLAGGRPFAVPIQTMHTLPVLAHSTTSLLARRTAPTPLPQPSGQMLSARICLLASFHAPPAAPAHSTMPPLPLLQPSGQTLLSA